MGDRSDPVDELLAIADREAALATSFNDVVRPLHVVAWVEQQTQFHKAPTAKLRLATIRHLFDWLVNGQVVPFNPAASVRRPHPRGAQRPGPDVPCWHWR